MIPSNLDECFLILLEMATEDQLTEFRGCTEKDLVTYHMGLGRWMRNEWGLWSGGSLKDYFEKLGLCHADDMSGVILTSFHKYLHNRPIVLEEQVQKYLDFWKGQKNV